MVAVKYTVLDKGVFARKRKEEKGVLSVAVIGRKAQEALEKYGRLRRVFNHVTPHVSSAGITAKLRS